MTENDKESGGPGTPRPPTRDLVRDAHRIGLRQLLKMRRALREQFGDQDLDDDAPQLVAMDERASDILTRARSLAADGRDDAAAAQELARLAGRHRRSLQLAALAARQGGAHHNSAYANLVHRLLQAALTGGPVAPPTAEDLPRFEVLDLFSALDNHAQWAELVRREPRLAEFDADASSGRYRFPAALLDPALAREQRVELSRQHRPLADELRQRLGVLLGPQSGQEDILLSSAAAFDAAAVYLTQPVG